MPKVSTDSAPQRQDAGPGWIRASCPGPFVFASFSARSSAEVHRENVPATCCTRSAMARRDEAPRRSTALNLGAIHCSRELGVSIAQFVEGL